LLRAAVGDVQVGGGIRTTVQVEEMLANGARAVVVGTRALEDPDWLAEVANTYPNEILVAADVRERRVVTHGWTRTLPREIVDVTEELSALPLAGLLVTAVHREGKMQGADLFLMEDVVEAASFPVFASGGVRSMADLRALADRGVAAAIIGMALYSGVIDPWQAAEEFSE
jgi:phosphoribosylformimino-5-aminoimidazole carboxamide ribotide isomerase